MTKKIDHCYPCCVFYVCCAQSYKKILKNIFMFLIYIIPCCILLPICYSNDSNRNEFGIFSKYLLDKFLALGFLFLSITHKTISFGRFICCYWLSQNDIHLYVFLLILYLLDWFFGNVYQKLVYSSILEFVLFSFSILLCVCMSECNSCCLKETFDDDRKGYL